MNRPALLTFLFVGFVLQHGILHILLLPFAGVLLMVARVPQVQILVVIAQLVVFVPAYSPVWEVYLLALVFMTNSIDT